MYYIRQNYQREEKGYSRENLLGSMFILSNNKTIGSQENIHGRVNNHKNRKNFPLKVLLYMVHAKGCSFACVYMCVCCEYITIPTVM